MPINQSLLWALGASFLNGTIGALNRFGFEQNLNYQEIAFYKCFIAFLILMPLVLFQRENRNKFLALRFKFKQLAILSFLGIFCLYFFETWAFAEASIPLVAFLIYAMGGVMILSSAYFLKERLDWVKFVAFVLMLGGILFLSSNEVGVSGSGLGIILALIGGAGYSFFLLLSKKFAIGSGISVLAWFFLLGSIYLAIPLWFNGMEIPNFAAMKIILLLVIFPTIGGYYCTMQALALGEASKVQIIETSDPLFASLFGVILFQEWLTGGGVMGASLIMAGLVMMALLNGKKQ